MLVSLRRVRFAADAYYVDQEIDFARFRDVLFVVELDSRLAAIGRLKKGDVSRRIDRALRKKNPVRRRSLRFRV